MSAAVLDAVNHLFGLVPDTLEKFMTMEESRGVPFFNDFVCAFLSGYDFVNIFVQQVTVEEENTLVIRSNGKRKREEVEEEGCKYLRLERRPPRNLLRKFRLPENCNLSAITAKCENGVLSVVVEKHPPLPKSKTVEVTIS